MTKKIQATKNYEMFKKSSGENRMLCLKKHKKLFESMKLYGFLKCYPIVAFRDKSGQLVVKDGQHRLAIASSLGLTVYWVEEEVDFNVAIVNSTAKVWTTKDYAEKWAANGKQDYTEGMAFAERHNIPIGIAFALLAGFSNFANCKDAFEAGLFKIKSRTWADSVAGIYGPMVAMSHHVKNARFLEACMAACRVKDFDGERLLHGAAACRDKLVSFSTRDAYLGMMEEIYNYRRRTTSPLKHDAITAMKERNAAHKKKESASQKKAA